MLGWILLSVRHWLLQVRTSYLATEILWGHRFDQSTVTYDADTSKYSVAFKTLNSFASDKTPRWDYRHHTISRHVSDD